MRGFTPSLIAIALASAAHPLHTATVFKCVDARGAVSFQDQPCRATETEQRVRLPDVPPPAVADEPPPNPPPVRERLPPIQPPAPPPTPAPSFYLCTRYDGSRYLSDTGTPSSTAVPLGVLGVPGRGLAEAYGPGGIGVSAPGLRQIPHVSASQVPFGGTYTWIDDECHLASPQEACAYLREQLDDVEAKLRRAFSDTEDELKRQQAALQQRMQSC